jgi:hypothetical protein
VRKSYLCFVNYRKQFALIVLIVINKKPKFLIDIFIYNFGLIVCLFVVNNRKLDFNFNNFTKLILKKKYKLKFFIKNYRLRSIFESIYLLKKNCYITSVVIFVTKNRYCVFFSRLIKTRIVSKLCLFLKNFLKFIQKYCIEYINTSKKCNKLCCLV